MQQQTLDFNRYPDQPGYKKLGTSSRAAHAMRKRDKALRLQCLELLQQHGELTPDEAAEILGKTPFSIRPRFSQLAAKGLIERTGAERMNDSGGWADVWRAKK